jgi:acyl-CoA synthetase (AMP-forming)/AMP-acid ligase II
MKSRLESYKVPLLYEQVERVNRTYNGKLDRKSYR